MFFQDAPPDTSGYMIAGYAIAFIVMGLYAASMYIRSRNLKQDRSILEKMDKPAVTAVKDEPKKAPKSTTAKPVATKTVTKK